MADYRLAPRAQKDADAIGEYSEHEWGAQQRRKYIDELRTVIEHLANMPGIGRKVSHLRAGLRAYPVGSHMVFYRQDSDGITVIRILHQSQNEMRAFKRGY